MKTIYKIQEEKQKFRNLLQDQGKIGPQKVTHRRTKTVMVLSAKDYEDLVSNKPSFKEFLLNCPKMDEDFEIERRQDYPRSIEL